MCNSLISRLSHLDIWNKKLRHKIQEDSVSWLPETPEFSLLWVQFAGFSVWPKGYWMHHGPSDYLDVQIVDKGDLLITQAGKETLVQENSVVLIPPGKHTLSTGPAGFCEKRYLGIRGAILFNHMEKIGLGKTTCFTNSNNEGLSDIFMTLFALLREQIPASALEHSVLSYRLLLYLANCVEQPSYPQELQKAKSFIDWNFAEPLSLDDICRHVGCGKTTLREQFKNHLKSTPIQYLISKRMQYAKQILMDQSLPIKTVAAKCGIKNQLYFSTIFRKHFACSPREYRRSMLDAET